MLLPSFPDNPPWCSTHWWQLSPFPITVIKKTKFRIWSVPSSIDQHQKRIQGETSTRNQSVLLGSLPQVPYRNITTSSSSSTSSERVAALLLVAFARLGHVLLHIKHSYTLLFLFRRSFFGTLRPSRHLFFLLCPPWEQFFALSPPFLDPLAQVIVVVVVVAVANHRVSR